MTPPLGAIRIKWLPREARESVDSRHILIPLSGETEASTSGPGFYATVRSTLDCLTAAVDRIRSAPLFYSASSQHLYVSDDPYWIQQQLGGPELDEVSAVEFLLTGYVTGHHTLDPRIRQLLAGEVLHAELRQEVVEVWFERAYRFVHEQPVDLSKKELLGALDEATMTCMERLTRVAADRQIVVPLSGGLDSRLVAMALKRLDYPSLLAFTYGRAGDAEAAVSQEVARQLGIPWMFVEYTHDKWRRWASSDEWGEYSRLAERLVSLPHIQDWPAAKEMASKALVDQNAVFVPRHTCVSGYVYDSLDPSSADAVGEAIGWIWGHHYSLMDVDAAGRHVGGENLHDLNSAVETRLRRSVCELSELGAHSSEEACRS